MIISPGKSCPKVQCMQALSSWQADESTL